MRRLGQFLAGAALAATLGAAQAGPLTGETLGINFGGPVPEPVSVGSGVEYTFNPSLTFDFTEDGLLTITWTNRSPIGLGAGFVWDISDINGTIASFTGFTLVSTSGVDFLTQSHLSFTADTLSLALTNTNWASGGTAILRIDFASPPATVPEPGSLGLAALALMGLGLTRRRKN